MNIIPDRGVYQQDVDLGYGTDRQEQPQEQLEKSHAFYDSQQ
jgi:hypothetical protein